MADGKSILSRYKARQNLSGIDLSGLDLTGWCFLGSNLDRANLTGCQGKLTDFRGASLKGAVLTDVQANRWNLTGADLRGAVFVNTQFLRHASLRATLLRDTHWQNVTLDVNGFWSAGADLPRDLPFHEIKGCGDNNPVIARMLHSHGFTDIARFVFGKDFFGEEAPCWTGAREWVERNRPHELDDLMKLLAEFPEWNLVNRWQDAQA